MRRFASLILVFIFGLTIRLVWIDRVPAGISHDELDYFLGGKFLALTGGDMTGTWKWWQLRPMQTETLTAELTPLYFVPAALILKNSLLAAKVTPILFGTMIAMLSYLLMLRLSKGNRNLSLVTAVTMALNPWNFILSRTGYEVTFASFWYLLSIVLYIYIDPNRKHERKNARLLIFSVIAFALGYFSYHGFKFLALFIAVSAIAGKYFLESKPYFTKKSFGFIVLYLTTTVILLFFSLANFSTYGDRTSELGMFNLEVYSDQVNMLRRLSVDNNFKPLLFNKAVLYVRHVISTYLDFFSPERLFFNTNDNFNFNFPNHGYFYLVDLLFVAIGLFVAVKEKRYRILVFLLLVSPIPSLVHNGVSYTIRSSFAAIPLTSLSAIGVYFLFVRIKSLIFQFSVISFLLMSYAIFLYTYFSSYSILSVDQYMLDYRLLSSYLYRSNSEVPLTVVSTLPYSASRQYLFFSNSINRGNVDYLQKQLRDISTKNIVFENIRFTSDCDVIENLPSGTVIFYGSTYIDCQNAIQNQNISFVSPLESIPSLNLGSPLDSRQYWKIFNASVCMDRHASGYIHINKVEQLAIEHLSDTDFCSTWVF